MVPRKLIESGWQERDAEHQVRDLRRRDRSATVPICSGRDKGTWSPGTSSTRTTGTASATSAATASSPGPCWTQTRRRGEPGHRAHGASALAARSPTGSGCTGCRRCSRPRTAPTATRRCRSRTPSGSASRIFQALVEDERPDVVVVDRHPYGTAGELRAGLELARRQGAAVVLGLRDVLDEPVGGAARSCRASAGRASRTCTTTSSSTARGTSSTTRRSTGSRSRCATAAGSWSDPAPRDVDPHLLVVAAGGGGDGAGVFELGAQLLAQRPELVGLFAPGPYAGADALRRLGELVAGPGPDRRARRTPAAGGSPRAGAILCMAGYNSTLEALAAGHRPILVPRRHPRSEQAIRAERLQRAGARRRRPRRSPTPPRSPRCCRRPAARPGRPARSTPPAST